MISHGDLFDVLPTLAAESIDACVTDPPYELKFMGKHWDGSGVAFQADTWREIYRVLKPGAHLLAFGGTRTFHRMTCAIEDAGFEIRDCLSWLYGQGFPKSLDVSKAIDKQRNERHAEALIVTQVIERAMRVKGLTRRDINLAVLGVDWHGGSAQSWTTTKHDGAHKPRVPEWNYWLKIKKFLDIDDALDADVWRLNGLKGRPGEAWHDREIIAVRKMTDRRGDATVIGLGHSGNADITSSSSDLAKQWDGWGTALKPAMELICLARKPLIGTVAANVLTHGTGAINIDACRIEYESNPRHEKGGSYAIRKNNTAIFGAALNGATQPNDLGRWPANVLLDEEAAQLLDEQSGELVSGSRNGNRNTDKTCGIYGAFKGGQEAPSEGDSGGASRFFYCAKPSREERDYGCESLSLRTPGEMTDRQEGSAGLNNPRAGAGRTGGGRNPHPTVKPVELMRWLVRLVTPPGGICLDPFTGSGTTGMACRYEQRAFIGIEREAEYVEIAEARIAAVAPLFHDEPIVTVHDDPQGSLWQ